MRYSERLLDVTAAASYRLRPLSGCASPPPSLSFRSLTFLKSHD
jgi:hypothetical protein